MQSPFADLFDHLVQEKLFDFGLRIFRLFDGLF